MADKAAEWVAVWVVVAVASSNHIVQKSIDCTQRATGNHFPVARFFSSVELSYADVTHRFCNLWATGVAISSTRQ